MLIKICGISKLEEIKIINEFKPDYIGFVFAKSKRQVSINEAKELYGSLSKSIKAVGVFRNNSEEEIMAVLSEIPLDVIQLHGDEDEGLILSLGEKVTCDIWKGVAIKDKSDLIKALNYEVKTLILDGGNPGSGETFPWEIFKGINLNRRIFLAGGIKEENVLEGIKLINPEGIDLSSGVEIEDEYGRRKSRDKIEKLIRKVREIS